MANENLWIEPRLLQVKTPKLESTQSPMVVDDPHLCDQEESGHARTLSLKGEVLPAREVIQNASQRILRRSQRKTRHVRCPFC